MDIKLKILKGPWTCSCTWFLSTRWISTMCPLRKLSNKVFPFCNSTLQAMSGSNGRVQVSGPVSWCWSRAAFLPKVAEGQTGRMIWEQDLLPNRRIASSSSWVSTWCQAPRSAHYSKKPDRVDLRRCELVHDKMTIDLFLAFSIQPRKRGACTESHDHLAGWV